MHAVADTNQLVADGIISKDQATTIETRARAAMVFLAINALLCGGILAATGGMIFWLADAASVAVCGIVSLIVGLLILLKGGALFRMFGNAAALVGAGMLIGGASLELMQNFQDLAGWVMVAGGGAIAAMAGWSTGRTKREARFTCGAIALMGGAAHLFGLWFLQDRYELSGLPIVMFHAYAAVLIALSGWAANIRLITALAIIPFAQMLDASTAYSHAVYVFYSPESTLSILQMSLFLAGLVWASRIVDERTARHLRILGVLAFIVANLCALVGSLWGDVVGQSIWGPGFSHYGDEFEAFKATALVISEEVYTAIWAIVLAGIVMWAAHKNVRGMFNTALTFGGIHGYTQLFENYGDQPLAFVVGGLVAIPLAWGMWQADHWIRAKDQLAAM